MPSDFIWMVAFLTVKAFYYSAFSIGDIMYFKCIFCSELYEVVILLLGFFWKNYPLEQVIIVREKPTPSSPLFIKFEWNLNSPLCTIKSRNSAWLLLCNEAVLAKSSCLCETSHKYAPKDRFVDLLFLNDEVTRADWPITNTFIMFWMWFLWFS